VRPTKLSIQGLTAYKQPVEIDFTDLDLFAITGPTGAGKSSLVDAITFALYGQAPRVGRNVKELISQGEERLKVTLEFAANGDKYRIYRSTARKGQAPVQLERFECERDEWVPEEVDRVRDTNAFIEELLQMDYEAFVRSVLLPQGQFQEFLAGDRDQRRKVLDGLLRLNIYGVMQQRANTIATDQTRKADDVRQRLNTEMADATPDALKAAKADIKQLKAHAAELAKIRVATDAAYKTADALSDARGREREALAELAKGAEALAAARKLLESGEQTLAAFDEQITAARVEIKAAEYDGDLHLRLTKCLPLLTQIETMREGETKLAAGIEKKSRDVEKLRADVETAKRKHDAARAAVAVRHDEYEAARHTNAAVLLRQGLAKDDPCPVCGQHVGTLPAGNHLALDKIKAAHDKAKTDEAAATTGVASAEKRLAVEERDAASRTSQLGDLRTQRTSLSKDLEVVTGEPELQAKVVEARLTALENAKRKLATLETTEKQIVAKREAQAKAIGDAQTDAARLEAEARTHETNAARATKDSDDATTTLTKAAKEMAWPDLTDSLAAELDLAPLLRERLASVQNEDARVNREIGANETRIAHIEKEIETAKALRGQERASREEATLARDLASLLRTDSFPTFLRHRAMTVLARAGSEQLRQISGGRYDLIADGQDFAVEDLWNASTPRPVRTLSGGETFLASLALALALAEHLPSLAGGGHQAALESLFIDEGFSHLDDDTLNTVANALEVLGQDRNRLIGVITHVAALAERMPARITVTKSQAGSTVTVE
jgi:DNA repair protein SbcC/Rad50